MTEDAAAKLLNWFTLTHSAWGPCCTVRTVEVLMRNPVQLMKLGTEMAIGKQTYRMTMTQHHTIDEKQISDSDHTCRNCVHAERSDWLNSYGTFQPMGPNLRRSCTMECRKHITNSSWRQSCRFTASSISCTSKISQNVSAAQVSQVSVLLTTPGHEICPLSNAVVRARCSRW